MQVEIKQLDGLSLAGKADSGHWVAMDGPKVLGGHGAATSPIELFLMGLGGCTSMDVISILKKKRVKLDSYECVLDADRAEEHPKVFTRVKITFKFWGRDIQAKDVERAIELSESTYCSASAMLKKAVDIEIDYEIYESDS